jgi:hypothetical protein
MVDQIDKEMRGSHVVSIGSPIKSFRLLSSSDELGKDQVLLTPSWLIHLIQLGTDFQFMRLDSVVMAFRTGSVVTLIDRYDVRLEIRGTLDGLTRLLAEILARVPWALSHFDADTERHWTENRQEIIAKMDRRRQQIMESTIPVQRPNRIDDAD